MKEDFFYPEAYELSIERLNKITPETKPKWGKMDAAQMMAHCSEVQEVMNGKALKTPFIFKLFMPMVKKAVIKGGYGQNLRTHPSYKQNSEKDFETEKQRLLVALDAFVSNGEEKAASTLHSFFGKMTAAEKGRAMYKHLDHHLKQFGV